MKGANKNAHERLSSTRLGAERYCRQVSANHDSSRPKATSRLFRAKFQNLRMRQGTRRRPMLRADCSRRHRMVPQAQDRSPLATWTVTDAPRSVRCNFRSFRYLSQVAGTSLNQDASRILQALCVCTAVLPNRARAYWLAPSESWTHALTSSRVMVPSAAILPSTQDPRCRSPARRYGGILQVLGVYTAVRPHREPAVQVH